MKMETVRFRGRNRRVPVDDDGLVPIGYLEEIQEKRTPRSRNIDARRRAVTTFPARPEPLQALMWRTYPGRYDIEGIDTPQIVVEEPVETVTIVPAPAPVAPRKIDVRDRGYSASTWRRKVDFDADPEKASREAARLLRAETMEATEDMRSYLDDCDYGEYGKGTRYRYDERDLVNQHYDKMWQEFRTEYYDQNIRGRRTSRHR